MKQLYLFFLLITVTASAQIPANYYDSANGLTGFALKTELRNITANGHTTRTYDQLYDGAGISGSQGYVDTHSDVNVSGGTNYEGDGTILDFYSENPTGADPYNYTHGNNQCGNQSAEGDCYNREHLVPQSSFSSAFPMQSDIHHVVPSDGRVNNFRGSLPFGNVATANWTSLNGSKRGSSAMVGYSGTVFEPIDEFKGDIARALLYFATRYENTVDGYTSFDMFNGTEDQVFFTWAIDVLLDWHYNVDPVDQRERDRNNAAYNFQGNANPFVDHPEYANMIWNPSPDNQAPTDPTNLVASNPTDNSIDLTWTASTDNVGVASYDIYIGGVNSHNTTGTSFTVPGLTANTNYCFTIKAKDATGNESGFSNQDCEMTTNNGSSGGSECANEDFENIPTTSSSTYLPRNWNDPEGKTWTATEARTDLTITNKSITIDGRGSADGTLTSPSFPNGIASLTATLQKRYGGTSGNLNVYVNDVLKGVLPYSSDENITTTTTIENIDVLGDVVIKITDAASDGERVSIDDLSWTCYTTLSNDKYDFKEIKLTPNPVKHNKVYINTNQELNIQVYDILGKLVTKTNIYSNKNYIDVTSLNKGVYLLRISNNKGQQVTKKLIRQ